VKYKIKHVLEGGELVIGGAEKMRRMGRGTMGQVQIVYFVKMTVTTARTGY
jgi:hypothetical protein